MSSARHVYSETASGETLLGLLPADVVCHLLLQEATLGAHVASALSCCSRSLHTQIGSNATLWRALLRQRHRTLFAESDPLGAMLPSAALERHESLSPISRPRWPQLYHECEREWLAAKTEPTRSTWTVWLAWRRRFPRPSHAGLVLTLNILCSAAAGSPEHRAKKRSNDAMAELGNLCALACAAAVLCVCFGPPSL